MSQASDPNNLDIGLWIIRGGIVAIVVGLIFRYAPQLSTWFGRLPGDLNWRTENTQVFIPITSMLIT